MYSGDENDANVSSGFYRVSFIHFNPENYHSGIKITTFHLMVAPHYKKKSDDFFNESDLC